VNNPSTFFKGNKKNIFFKKGIDKSIDKCYNKDKIRDKGVGVNSR
jgi:hypothetical protein